MGVFLTNLAIPNWGTTLQAGRLFMESYNECTGDGTGDHQTYLGMVVPKSSLKQWVYSRNNVPSGYLLHSELENHHL